MAKVVVPSCAQCGNPIGFDKMRCAACGHWADSPVSATKNDDFDSIMLSKVISAAKDRLSTGPWDTVWGGDVIDGELVEGIVLTSVTLLGGAPGAGKSTLVSQILGNCPAWGHPDEAPIYIAAEEAPTEIKLRTDRLGISLAEGRDIRMVPALNGASVGAVLSRYRPKLIVIDSLQGLVGKDDEAQEEVCKIAKTHAVRLRAPVIIVSHVTKDEVLAGKMTLQHVVDVTMVFYPSADARVLMATKNRFGPAFKEAAFEMTGAGLVHLENSEDILEE